ncbi:TPA: glycosyltransferase family 2 protein [Streptococcus suis]
MHDLVSIVIPVYNSEKTIGRLISILKQQTYDKIEVIIVNDGSTDRTLSIITDSVDLDDRFKIFTKKNEGVSMARNFGISQITGKYVTFVDSDDLLLTNSIQLLLDNIRKSDSDFSIGSYTRTNSIINRTNFKGNYETSYIKKEEIKLKILYPNKDNKFQNMNFRTVWGKLYKTRILRENSIQFPTGLKLFEDGLFNLLYLENIENVSILEDTVYIYNVSETSAVHKIYSDMPEIYDKIKSNLQNISLKHRNDGNEFVNYLNCCLFEFFCQLLINNFKLGIKTQDTYSNNEEQIKDVISDINPNQLTQKHRIVFYFLKYKLFQSLDFLVSLK